MNKRPNILMIVADQHRYDCVGYSQRYPVNTPNIDRIAAEGLWFSNAYTPIPLCCPARQSLLNGRRPEAFGGLWNYEICLDIPALDPSEYSWTKELQSQGYRQGYVGKWHVSPTHDPTHFGFSHYVSEREYENFVHDNYPDIKLKNAWFGETNPVPLEDSKTHWLAARAINLIETFATEDAPWHLRLDFSEPHLPCQPSQPYADMYPPHTIPKWGSFEDPFLNKPYIQGLQLFNWGIENFTWEDWAPAVARYYGIISQMDDAIGRVMETLNRLGLSEDTLVIYTADHGDMCGSHRMIDKHYVMYEDIVKVPFVIRWPGVIDGGTRCEKFVYQFLDIPPTILEVLDLPPQDFFHGKSLLPFLQGMIPDIWREEVVSTYNGQQFGLYTQRMIRNDRWKYIWNATDVDELYDMQQDVDELHNLIHEDALGEMVATMQKKLVELLLQEGDGMLRSPWMKNQLLTGSKQRYDLWRR